MTTPCRLILLLLLLTGCYNARKATQQVDRAILQYPEAAAAELRKAFPCEILARTDTLTTTRDTTIFVDCPEVPDSTVITELIRDTVRNTITRTIRVPVKLPVQVQTVTRYVEDQACVAIVKAQEREIADLKERLATSKGKKNMWFWIAMGLLALDAVWIFSKLKSIGLPKIKT